MKEKKFENKKKQKREQKNTSENFDCSRILAK